jgi:predicted RNA binding protein YcfA (HicA-like mRNA interferase family)
MPKLGPYSAKDVCRILQLYGFHKVRQSGSHIIMQKTVVSMTITVPIPNHAEIAKGTLKSIIRMSGLDVDLFLK